MILVVGGFMTSYVKAAEFLAPDNESEGSVLVGSQEVKRNLYTAGAMVALNGTFQGDLFAAGSQLNLDGEVEKDAFFAGANLSINGKVGEDLRVAGANITINSPIGGDALVAGGNVLMTGKASVRQDLIIAAGTLNLEAPVEGGMKVAGNKIFINSRINGDVVIRAKETVVFGKNAEITGKIKVFAPKAPEIRDGAKLSEPEFIVTQGRNSSVAVGGALSAMLVLKLLAGFIAVWVIWKVSPKWVGSFLETAKAGYLKNLGLGVAVMVLMPIIGILGILSMVGWMLGILIFVAFLVLVFLSLILSPVIFGVWLYKWLKKSEAWDINWQVLILGVLGLTLVGLVPVAGWIVGFAMFVLALGSVSQLIWKNIKN